MVTLLIATHRMSDPQLGQRVWGDLRLALLSVAEYAPEADVIVAWGGDEAPKRLPENPRMRLYARPSSIGTSTEAWNWCADKTDDEDIVIMNDDAVLHPDAIRFLMEDVQLLKNHPAGIKVGMVGMRSNFIKGPQNIRWANGGDLAGPSFTSEQTIIEVDIAVPVIAYASHRAFDEVGQFPHTNWFGDDILAWEMKQRGYRHFVSRAYCHHVGQRGTGQHKTSEDLLREGLEWVKANRPEFMPALTGVR